MKIKLTIFFGLMFITNVFSYSSNDTITIDGFFTDEMWDSSPKIQKLIFYTTSKELSELPIESIETIAYTDSIIPNGINIVNSYRNKYVTIKAICLSDENTTSFNKKTIDWTFKVISITIKENQNFDWESLPSYKTMNCEVLYLGCEDVSCYSYIKESDSKPIRSYTIRGRDFAKAESTLKVNQYDNILFEKVPNIDETSFLKYFYIPYFDETIEIQPSAINQRKDDSFDASNPALSLKIDGIVNYFGVKYLKNETIIINSDRTKLELKNISERISCDDCKGKIEKKKEVISIYQILSIKNPISGEYTFKLKILKSTEHKSYYNGYDDYQYSITTGSLFDVNFNEGDFWINFIPQPHGGSRRCYSFISKTYMDFTIDNIISNKFDY